MKILLATDGSDYAHSATLLLSRLPAACRDQVDLLTVIDTLALPLPADPTKALPVTAETLHQRAQEILQRERQALEPLFREVSTSVREGNPAAEIVAAAKETGTDLVAAGSRGEAAWERYLLGSISHRVLLHAPCSVLLARPAGSDRSRKSALKILFASDGSDPAQAAAAWLQESGITQDSELVLVRVMTLIRAFRMDLVQTSSPAWAEETAAANADLERLKAGFQASGTRVTTELRTGYDAAAELVDAAEQHGADILVVGSRGAGAINRFLLGSVSSKVAHHADCSVMVVR